ncbi:MAG: ABC transporter substrate-binding protein [Coriobacteriales bacterium]|jgi:peptide/nickel transport system substrate-binding protein|nr:ABC transporter substrate-binding protein [Coriobacteriales bacterium]
MSKYSDENHRWLTRRGFLKGAAVGAISVGTLASTSWLYGCSDSPDSEPTESGESSGPVTGGELTYALATKPTTLDPPRAGMIVDHRVLFSLFERLFHWVEDEGGGKLEPWLATEWELDKDGKSYVLKLREGVSFHDGTPFNAEAVKYNIEHFLDPATATVSAISLQPYTSADVLDEYTIRLNLESPSSVFLTSLASIFILSPTAAKAAGDQFGTNPVGTGPFIFDSWDEDIIVKRNPDYTWGPDVVSNQGPAYLDQITFKVVPEEATRIGSVQSEQIHLAETIPPQNYAELESDPSLQVFKKAAEGLAYTLFFVVSRAPYSELKVRQAIVAGVDVKTIIDTIYLGVYEQAFSPFTKGFSYYANSLDGVNRYDPEKAKRLLDDAGWKVGADGIREKDGKRLTLDYGDSSPNREKRNDVAFLIQNQLKEIGVEVKIDITTDLGNRLIARNYDFWGNSIAIIEPILGVEACYGSGKNYSDFNDPQIDELLAQIKLELDLDKRTELLIELQERIIDQALIIPIYDFYYTVLAASPVKDFKLFPLGFPNYLDVYLREE